jgi:hypothetical protein
MTKQVMALAACAAWFLAGVLQPAGAEEPALNTLSPQEKAGGWKLLFDLQDHGGRVEFRNIKIHVLP